MFSSQKNNLIDDRSALCNSWLCVSWVLPVLKVTGGNRKANNRSKMRPWLFFLTSTFELISEGLKSDKHLLCLSLVVNQSELTKLSTRGLRSLQLAYLAKNLTFLWPKILGSLKTEGAGEALQRIFRQGHLGHFWGSCFGGSQRCTKRGACRRPGRWCWAAAMVLILTEAMNISPELACCCARVKMFMPSI